MCIATFAFRRVRNENTGSPPNVICAGLAPMSGCNETLRPSIVRGNCDIHWDLCMSPNSTKDAFMLSFIDLCWRSMRPLVDWWYGGTKVTSTPRTLCKSCHKPAWYVSPLSQMISCGHPYLWSHPLMKPLQQFFDVASGSGIHSTHFDFLHIIVRI